MDRTKISDREEFIYFLRPRITLAIILRSCVKLRVLPSRPYGFLSRRDQGNQELVLDFDTTGCALRCQYTTNSWGRSCSYGQSTSCSCVRRWHCEVIGNHMPSQCYCRSNCRCSGDCFRRLGDNESHLCPIFPQHSIERGDVGMSMFHLRGMVQVKCCSPCLSSPHLGTGVWEGVHCVLLLILSSWYHSF